MKKTRLKKKANSVDMESLRRWKGLSTKAKLNWLDNAFKLGKFGSF